ncbi:MAG: hypothetical protein M0P77_06315 [Firmicutes bacterium]|nr:hypothetical protein [Bacillota bacterium]
MTQPVASLQIVNLGTQQSNQMIYALMIRHKLSRRCRNVYYTGSIVKKQVGLEV